MAAMSRRFRLENSIMITFGADQKPGSGDLDRSANRNVITIASLIALVLFVGTPVFGQVDFIECGIFETDFGGCVLFFPDSGFPGGVQADLPNPPMNQIVRVTGISYTCGGFCFPDLCIFGAQIFFDCPGSPPGESECSNGQDDDADGLTDCCDPDCACTPGIEFCDNGFDDDCDGLVDLQDPDCSGSPPGGVFVRGDSNGDGSVDVADAVLSLGYLFLGETVQCLDAADVSDDGNINIADPVSLLNALFSSSASPAPPYPDCGLDPTTDDHSCWFYFVCP